jgi:hypothetical protein
MTTYRGNLTLRENATVDEHKSTVSKFFRNIRERSKRAGVTLRFYMTAHITSPTEQHYDFTAYSDAPQARVRDTIRDVWIGVGGLRYSLAGIDTEGEKIATAKYQAKDTKSEEKKFKYLPAKNGLSLTPYSTNFFCGMSKDDLWAEWIAETYPADVSNNDKGYDDVCPDLSSGPHDDLRRLTERERDFALGLIRRYLPRTPTEVISPYDLSRKVSIPREWLLRLLANVPGSERFNGGYWLRWATDPVPGSEPVGPTLDTDDDQDDRHQDDDQDTEEVSRHPLPNEQSEASEDRVGDGLSEQREPVTEGHRGHERHRGQPAPSRLHPDDRGQPDEHQDDRRSSELLDYIRAELGYGQNQQRISDHAQTPITGISLPLTTAST